MDLVLHGLFLSSRQFALFSAWPSNIFMSYFLSELLMRYRFLFKIALVLANLFGGIQIVAT